jgi:hypothetical protein
MKKRRMQRNTEFGLFTKPSKVFGFITEFMHSIEDKPKKRFKYAGETDEHYARPGKNRPPHGKKAPQK